MKAHRLARRALLLLAAAGICGTAQAASFWDGFDNNWYNTTIWEARSGANGGMFGCTFYPDVIQAGTGGTLNMRVWNGACSELRTKTKYQYGTLQTRMKAGWSQGTVSSLFTYDSWSETAGNPWTEIDIEFLPSFGNVMHTNIIYQANSSSTLYMYQKDISLSSYGINVFDAPIQVGFDWTADQVAWYVLDSAGVKRYLRTVVRSDATGCDCIPTSRWPSKPAKIMANHWHGNNANSDSVNYFPKTYDYSADYAVYDWIQFVDY